MQWRIRPPRLVATCRCRADVAVATSLQDMCISRVHMQALHLPGGVSHSAPCPPLPLAARRLTVCGRTWLARKPGTYSPHLGGVSHSAPCPPTFHSVRPCGRYLLERANSASMRLEPIGHACPGESPPPAAPYFPVVAWVEPSKVMPDL